MTLQASDFSGEQCPTCHAWIYSTDPCRECHPGAVRCHYCAEWCEPGTGDADVYDGKVCCGAVACDARAALARAHALPEWTCADCHGTYCGTIQHRGRNEVPVCCRCWADGTDDVCYHP